MDKSESKRIPETSGIYLIVNPKGKKYVGQSKNLRKRYKDYLQKAWLKKENSKSKIKHSFAKYGSENHHFEILEELDMKLLAEREERWITVLGTLKNGLNTIDRNYTIFEFKRKKGKTQPWSEERKENHTKAIKKAAEKGSYKKSKESKRKISKALKGIVTAWDTEGERYVSVKKEDFDLNDKLVGTTAKGAPGKRKPKKPMINNETGEIYDGVKDCIKKVGKSSCFVYVGIKKGLFSYL